MRSHIYHKGENLWYRLNGSLLSIQQIDPPKGKACGKEHIQTCGIDYQETFAPVAKLTSIKMLITLAS
jgi:hypothetical protein